MKTILIILLSFSLNMIAQAQTADKVLARVKYNFTHTRDTLSRNNPYTENMLLVIGKNASVFTSLDKIERDLDLPKAKPSPTAPFKPVNSVDLYFFVKENKLIARERFMNAYYLIDEASQQINWKLAKDTASLNGIKCKKAMATFKGRNWIAWYAPELPFQSGPWKLNGLPGLIIQAYDEKKEVLFEFAGIDNLKNENLSTEEKELAKVYERSLFFNKEIALPTDATKTTRVEFDKILELYRKDPKGFIAAATGTPKENIRMGGSMTGVSHNIINNPIELPEKK